jgi:aspartate carbamoyltransferase catalytic subunit
MKERFKTLKGLKVAILGDIKHSRVAKSNLFGLLKLGSEVVMYAPSTLIPKDIELLGAKIAKSKKEALSGADVVMGLRIQMERQTGGLFPSLSEYSEFYGVNDEDLKITNFGSIVMHPGPVNRGVELTSKLIDGDNSLIEEQVLSGVAVRMAILFLLGQIKR